MTWLKKIKDNSGRIGRWAIELQQYDFEIKYRKGKDNIVPDALSRMKIEEELAGITEVRNDKYLKEIENIKKNPKKYRDLLVNNGLIYKFRDDNLLSPLGDEEEKWKLLIPEELKERVLKEAHNTSSSGHLGVKKTYDRVARQYYWKGIYYDVESYVRRCEKCQKYKVSQTGQQGLMGNRIVERPWVIIADDLLEFPRSKGLNI